jgi:hypothetical protein
MVEVGDDLEFAVADIVRSTVLLKVHLKRRTVAFTHSIFSNVVYYLSFIRLLFVFCSSFICL